MKRPSLTNEEASSFDCEYAQKRIWRSRMIEKIEERRKQELEESSCAQMARKLVLALYTTRGEEHFQMEKLLHAFRQRYPQECESALRQMKRLREIDQELKKTHEKPAREDVLMRRLVFLSLHAWLAIDEKPKPPLSTHDMRLYTVLSKKRPFRKSLLLHPGSPSSYRVIRL